MDMPVIKLTDDSYSKELAGSKLPVLVVFCASFCGPSEMLKPVIDQIVEDYDGVVVYAEADVENCPKMAREFQVKGTPTCMIMDRGVPLASMIGTMSYDDFAGWLDKNLCR